MCVNIPKYFNVIDNILSIEYYISIETSYFIL